MSRALLIADREVFKGCFFPTFCGWLCDPMGRQLDACEENLIPLQWQVVGIILIELDRPWEENIPLFALCDPDHSAVPLSKFKSTKKEKPSSLALFLRLSVVKQRRLRPGSRVTRSDVCLSHVNFFVNLIAIEPIIFLPFSLDMRTLGYECKKLMCVANPTKIEACKTVNRL